MYKIIIAQMKRKNKRELMNILVLIVNNISKEVRENERLLSNKKCACNRSI